MRGKIIVGDNIVVFIDEVHNFKEIGHPYYIRSIELGIAELRCDLPLSNCIRDPEVIEIAKIFIRTIEKYFK